MGICGYAGMTVFCFIKVSHYQMKKKRGETLVFSKVLHKYVGRRKAEFLPYPAQKTKGAAAETSVGTVHPSANTCVKMRLRRQ